jgi:hypothetical protein
MKISKLREDVACTVSFFFCWDFIFKGQIFSFPPVSSSVVDVDKPLIHSLSLSLLNALLYRP